MSAEDRLQALEELVTVMHGEVFSARTADAQAEQRSTDAETRVLGVRGEGVVDTRLLGNQRASTVRRTTGDSSSSRSWTSLVQFIRDSSN